MREKIARALSEALKIQDRRRISTLRLIQMAIKDRDAANRMAGKDPLSDEEIAKVLTRMVKQREDSARAFEEASRLELAEQERREIEIILECLPRQLGEEDMKKICAQVVNEVGAGGLRDMRRCMNALKEKFPLQVDLGKASSIMREMLR
ncbi:GatB/YqeY domain-containing protein [Chelativorans sp. Marseille-P2723]|uniref:GatB/YqeY domain-containing protein n=1 Tax=Chelativorans sp. Marseille-P2723 TaxID=2709133 RepID=UPI00156D53A8|nr:GatB/YqeY domain-containing protein [Chelativorans sp. Marseille-P2723]